MRNSNVVLIIDRYFSAINESKTQPFSDLPDLFVSNQSIAQLDKYISDLTDYGLLNGCKIPNQLIFIVVPEDEYSQHVDNFMISNKYTFLILNHVSYRMKSKFDNYNPQIIYE